MFYLFDLVQEAKNYGRVPETDGAQKNTIDYFDSTRAARNGRPGDDPLRQPATNDNDELFWNIDDAMNLLSQTTFHNTHYIPMGGIQGRLWWGTGLLLLVESMAFALLAYVSKTAKSVHANHHLDAQIQEMQDQMDDQEQPLVVSLLFLPYLSDYFTYNTITTAALCGSVVGAFIWGLLADIVGRRRITLAISTTITVFGILLAVSCHPSPYMFPSMLASSIGLGFGVGGCTVPFDYVAEWLPNRTQRGHALLSLAVWWTAGSLCIYFVIQGTFINDWQWIVVLCTTLPAGVATFIFLLPLSSSLESPRWLLSQGRMDEALEVLRSAATAQGQKGDELFPSNVILYTNEKQSIWYSSTRRRLPPIAATAETTHLTNAVHCYNNYQSSNSHNGNYNGHVFNAQEQIAIHASFRESFREVRRLVFNWDWVKLSSALLVTYFGQAFCYHGTITMSVDIFSQDTRQQNYQAVFSAGAEIMGIFLLVLAIDRWGRIPTQVLSYALASLTCLTLAVWYEIPFLENGNTLIVMVFLGRMMLYGGGATTAVSTTEVLTTEIRTTGHAIAGMVGRLGGVASSLILNPISNIPTEGLVIFVIGLWITMASTDIPETHAKELGLSYHFLSSSSSTTPPPRPRRQRQ